MSNRGLTYEQIKDVLKGMTGIPAIGDLSFVENRELPEHTIMVSSKIMEILKNVFEKK